MEAWIRLNQVIARMAKQMCRAELSKEFSHWLPQVGIAGCERNMPAPVIAPSSLRRCYVPVKVAAAVTRRQQLYPKLPQYEP
jgi:hypothetical protein